MDFANTDKVWVWRIDGMGLEYLPPYAVFYEVMNLFLNLSPKTSTFFSFQQFVYPTGCEYLVYT